MPESSHRPQEKRQTLLGTVFGKILSILFWLIMAAVFSIVIEWLGMVYFWPEQCFYHAQNMYHQELRYLHQGVRQRYIQLDQVQSVQAIYLQAEHWGKQLVMWQPIQWLTLQTEQAFSHLKPFLIAAKYTLQTFVVRFGLLLLSWPAFLIALIVGACDGLVERDLRKFGGGRESTTLFLLGKHSIMPLAIGTWVVYLSLPISIHPSLVIVPFVVVFAYAVRLACERMKKYI